MGKPVEVDIAPFIKLVACSLCALLSHATMLICACKFIAERDPIGCKRNDITESCIWFSSGSQ